jgi:hypothetical protein
LTGTGLLTGLYPLTQGTPLVGVPTLAFGVGAAGATTIMNFCVTAFTTGLTGVAFATGSSAFVMSAGNIITATPLWTNPINEKAITFPRPARMCSLVGGVAITAANTVIEDNGYGIQGVPALVAFGIVTTGAVTGYVPLTGTVGGVTDTSFLQPI